MRTDNQLLKTCLHNARTVEWLGFYRFKPRHKGNRFLTCLEACMLRNPNYFRSVS